MFPFRASDDLDEVRRQYAERVAGGVRPADPRLVAAFAAIPREQFLGPGPWLVMGEGGFIRTPDDDPRRIYHDVLVALDPLRGINNGEPSLHAAAIASLRLTEGEIVVHVGCGTGYYTAILAALVGSSGHVHGYEIEPDFAERARECVADRPNLTIHGPEDCDGPLPEADAIYVSAGSSSPLPAWLDALKYDGRLLFPLTNARGRGFLLLVERRVTCQVLAATALFPVAFIQLVGGADPVAAPKIAKAADDGRLAKVRSLRLGPHVDKTHCLLEGNGWWLSSVPPEEP